MWNHYLPAFHFNWLYSVLRPPSSNTKTQDIMELLKLCLNPAYFQYNGEQYRQLWNSNGFAGHRNTGLTRQQTTRLLSQQRLWLTSKVLLRLCSTNLTTLWHPCSPQTYHYFTTHSDPQRQGQRPTSRQTGSGVQNQVYWLPGYLYWEGWQKPENKTNWTQTSDQERWYQQPHCWTPLTY